MVVPTWSCLFLYTSLAVLAVLTVLDL
jgi:hypothetical protein